jgi:hypothetical protein
MLGSAVRSKNEAAADRYEIGTSLAPPDALARLATAVEPRRGLRKPFAAQATFQGAFWIEAALAKDALFR